MEKDLLDLWGEGFKKLVDKHAALEERVGKLEGGDKPPKVKPEPKEKTFGDWLREFVKT